MPNNMFSVPIESDASLSFVHVSVIPELPPSTLRAELTHSHQEGAKQWEKTGLTLALDFIFIVNFKRVSPKARHSNYLVLSFHT